MADETNPNEVLLIDLSSIAHPIWHMSQADPDPNKASQQIVARVRALAGARPRVAICCDSGRSFRKDIAASYKGNRPEHEATLHHQITLAIEQLEADGFPIWKVSGLEADDVIASAVYAVLEDAERTALIVSADKDLLQLVGPCCRQMRPDSGEVLDEAAVVVKFGVKPGQMRDYLTLVGDASDNIKGAQGIGAKTAMALLQHFGSLDKVYTTFKEHPLEFKPGMARSLREFEHRMPETRALVTLKTDAALPIEELERPRVPAEAASYGADLEDETSTEEYPKGDATGHAVPQIQQPSVTEHVATPAGLPLQAPPAVPASSPVIAGDRPSDPKGGASDAQSTAAAAPIAAAAPAPTPRPQLVEAPAAPAKLSELATPAQLMPAQYERTLDPVTLPQAIQISKYLHESRMFSAYGTPQAVLSTLMLGRELGLPAMQALRQIHNIDGKHALSADLMVALILRSGQAEYFEPVEFDDQHAVWVTKRVGGRSEHRIEHTIAMAQAAGLVKDKSNWVKVPIDMLNARAKSRLARLVYPDIVGGLYTPEELRDARTEAA